MELGKHFQIKDVKSFIANSLISQFIVEGNRKEGFKIFFSFKDSVNRCAIVPTRSNEPRIIKSSFTLTKLLHGIGVEKWAVETTKAKST